MTDSRYQLKQADWEWTAQSDEDSLHDGVGTAFAAEDLLETDVAVAQIDALKALGCEHVGVVGGSIFYRDDWEHLARTCKARGLPLTLTSNGHGIPDAVKTVGECFEGVVITLEGPEMVHDQIRQRSGSFVRAVEALESLQQAGIPTRVMTTVSNHNTVHLDAIRQMVAEAGAQEWILRTTLSSGAVKRPDYAEYTVTPWDIPFLVSYIAKSNREPGVRLRAGCDIGYFERETEIRPVPWGGCGAGFYSLGLEWNGNVKGCLCLPDEYVEANVRDMPLADIWHHDEAFAYNRRFHPEAMTGYCRICPHAVTCGCGCLGAAVASSGSRFDNLYCFQRATKEKQFRQDHPPGGDPPLDASTASAPGASQPFDLTG